MQLKTKRDIWWMKVETVGGMVMVEGHMEIELSENRHDMEYWPNEK